MDWLTMHHAIEKRLSGHEIREQRKQKTSLWNGFLNVCIFLLAVAIVVLVAMLMGFAAGGGIVWGADIPVKGGYIESTPTVEVPKWVIACGVLFVLLIIIIGLTIHNEVKEIKKITISKYPEIPKGDK